MKLLLTGGAGFIGSHIAEAALRDGWDVVCVDDLSHGRRENVPKGARLVVCDVGAPEFAAVVGHERPDAVDHHAAQIDVRKAVDDPVTDARQNILGLLNVLQACVHHGVRKVVFASSGGAIYGEQDVFPASEAHRTAPLSPYGITKLTGEHYLDFFRNIHKLQTVALRYANVYGPRQDAHGDAGVVAIFASRLLAGTPCTVFGDGEQTRDYVFVEDVARANLMALRDGCPPGPFNIGTARETSVNELYRILAQAADRLQEPAYSPARPGEVLRSCLDPTMAARKLGWKPTVMLDDGLRRTLAWFRARS